MSGAGLGPPGARMNPATTGPVGSTSIRRGSGRLAWMADELVGRDDDLTQIRAARLQGAAGVIVTAAPGMGRSSVFNSMVIEWRGRRSDVLLLRATASARSLRFATLSSVLPNDVDGPLTF